MVDCVLLTGSFSSTSSRAQYQFIYLIVNDHDTSLIVNQALTEGYSEIINEAEEIHEYTGISFFFPLFGLYHGLNKIYLGRGLDFVATGQSGIAVLPSLVLRFLLRVDWVMLAWDPPEGKIRVIREFSDEPIYEKILYSVDYNILLFAYRIADATILSDESTVIETEDESVVVAPGGVDCELVEKIRATCSRETVSDSLKVVYLGNMHYNRGIDVILEAFNRVNTPVELVLIGPGPEVASMKEQRQLERVLPEEFNGAIRFKGDSTSCEYLGELDHRAVLRKLLSSDVGLCILPYERDLPHFQYTYPIKIFEYMACSMAVIATRTPATKEVLKDDFQLIENDPQVIADKIEQIDESRTYLDELKNSNKANSKEYCWDSVRHKIGKELESREIGV